MYIFFEPFIPEVIIPEFGYTETSFVKESKTLLKNFIKELKEATIKLQTIVDYQEVSSTVLLVSSQARKFAEESTKLKNKYPDLKTYNPYNIPALNAEWDTLNKAFSNYNMALLSVSHIFHSSIKINHASDKSINNEMMKELFSTQ